MSTKKKGDILEWMVHILEQSLATNASKLVRQHPLKDEHGVKRAVDIYAETQVNGKTLKYAFECKNHKSGIKISHITDFHSMISSKGIKGFFVSTSNYQKGAKEKAAALGIELLHLKKREANPNDIKGLIFVRKNFKVTDIKILGNLKEGQSINPNDLIENCPVCSKRVIDIVIEDVIPFMQNKMDAGVEAVHPDYKDIRKLGETIGERNAKELAVLGCFDDSSITHKGLVICYNYIVLTIKVWNEAIEKEPVSKQLYSYLGNTADDLLASFSVNEFLVEDQNLVLGITTLKDGKRKLSVTNNVANSSTVSEMVCFGHIDELGIKKALKNQSGEHS